MQCKSSLIGVARAREPEDRVRNRFQTIIHQSLMECGWRTFRQLKGCQLAATSTDDAVGCGPDSGMYMRVNDEGSNSGFWFTSVLSSYQPVTSQPSS
jgi:hypothetical protein